MERKEGMVIFFVGAGITCILLIIICFFLKLTAVITYVHEGEDDELRISLKVLPFIKYEVNLSAITIDKDSAAIRIAVETSGALGEKKVKDKYTVQGFLDDLKKMERMIRQVVGFYTIVTKLLKKVTVRSLKWNTVIGLEDAAITSTLCGGLWGLKGSIIGIISKYFNMRKPPQLVVKPNFERPGWKTSFVCIVSFRIGHAIYAAIKVFRHWKKGSSQSNNGTEQTLGRNMHV